MSAERRSAERRSAERRSAERRAGREMRRAVLHPVRTRVQGRLHVATGTASWEKARDGLQRPVLVSAVFQTGDLVGLRVAEQAERSAKAGRRMRDRLYGRAREQVQGASRKVNDAGWATAGARVRRPVLVLIGSRVGAQVWNEILAPAAVERGAVKAGEQVQVRAGNKAYAYYGLQERVTGPVNRQVWTTLLDPVLRVAWEGVQNPVEAQMTRGRP